MSRVPRGTRKVGTQGPISPALGAGDPRLRTNAAGAPELELGDGLQIDGKQRLAVDVDPQFLTVTANGRLTVDIEAIREALGLGGGQ